MPFPVATDHMRRDGLKVSCGTMLRTRQIAVTHQRDILTIDTDDTVYNITAPFDPSQHHITDFRLSGLLQDDALTPADDKRQHAPPVDGQRHAYALVHQPDGLLNNIVVSHFRLYSAFIQLFSNL